MPTPAVHLISTSTVKPCFSRHYQPPQRCNLTPWDLSILSVHYIQKGLLFYRPNSSDGQEQEGLTITTIIERLKHSLSHAIAHFYPLAGRLVTEMDPSSSFIHIFIDCNDAGGEFIHAAADMTVANVLSPPDVPPIVRSFFPLTGAVNHDGHSLPLFAVQLTELIDGFFLACSFNHVVGDGSSFWHFFNSWSEISRKSIPLESDHVEITRPPVIARDFIHDVEKSPVRLHFSHPDEFIDRFSLPPLRERFFHFAAESIARLKAKANEEQKTGNKISSFQALMAHLWRSMTRARRLPDDLTTCCRYAIDNRSRLDPPLSRDYFGNCIQSKPVTATVGELLANGLGWAAWLLHDSVVSHSDATARQAYRAWIEAPFVYSLRILDAGAVVIGSSPRFDVYGVDFGWGKAVAVRSGQDNKFDGRVIAFPGREGGGSADMEICLAPEVMSALESDEDFMDAVSPTNERDTVGPTASQPTAVQLDGVL
ncbi:uncharacterized acetyltransferase At3g50280-like [Magnolia sinica]|uniref:uncharacterized acetyltransferase At3g50280-like n=1 Tax=Magnolia sinica TaxID=86752 RepID=UPI00265A396F|nr:uncharacterized acetyltransferase At3g50280-like [Magnolia sinica]